jgi:hypothetical protein
VKVAPTGEPAVPGRVAAAATDDAGSTGPTGDGSDPASTADGRPTTRPAVSRRS